MADGYSAMGPRRPAGYDWSKLPHFFRLFPAKEFLFVHALGRENHCLIVEARQILEPIKKAMASFCFAGDDAAGSCTVPHKHPEKVISDGACICRLNQHCSEIGPSHPFRNPTWMRACHRFLVDLHSRARRIILLLGSALPE
jgi:hypothetical protein